MHAMRGISAHSNGFQTCRMLHLLQILLGSIDCPGGFRYKAPFPRPTPPPNRPARPSEPNTPLKGAPLGFPQGPEDLLVDADGKPQRIDKAYSWDAPLAAHGLMHMVITNAATADPYPVDVLFMYMANMSWNSSMNIPAVLRHLTAKDDKTGEYKIPKIIYSDAYSSEMVAYADLILPDTTYLERWDCISLLDRPISGADAPADAIRQPVVAPDRDVRPFQTVLLDLGARLGLPGFVTDTGSAALSRRLSGLHRQPRAQPRHRLARGLSRRGRQELRPRRAQSEAARLLHRRRLLPRASSRAGAALLQARQQGLSRLGQGRGLHRRRRADHLPALSRAVAEIPAGGARPRRDHSRRRRTARGSRNISIRSRSGIRRSRATPSEGETFSAITQRPMHMYHSWGSHNGWLRQITAENCLYMNRARAQKLGIADGDWVWIKSAIGRVKGRVRLMEGVNPDTVWTWNAIGRRAGAAALDTDAPEATRGFLLNHLITELLPEREGGYRFSNSDPITGQAAWYDLRVSIEKAAPDEVGETWPQFVPLHSPPLAQPRPHHDQPAGNHRERSSGW